MPDKRIIDYNEAESLSSDDYLIVDGTTNGTRKIKPNQLQVATDKTLSIEDSPADAKAVGDELSDVKADLSEIDRVITDIGEYVINYTVTKKSSTALRKFYVFPFLAGTRYKVKIVFNSIPQKNGSGTHFAYSSATTNSAQYKVENITPDMTNVQSGSEYECIFTPIANAQYSYIYINSLAGEVDIEIRIKTIQPLLNGIKKYKRIGSVSMVSESAQRLFFPFKMLSGVKYNFRVYIQLDNAVGGSSTYTICAISATSPPSGSDVSIHDTIVRIKQKQSESILIGFGSWQYIEYEAQNNTDYLELYINYCDPGSFIIVEAEDGNKGLEDYIYDNNFTIRNHGERMIYDNKPYSFKRLGSYTGTGQSIVERDGDIFVFTNGKMIRYHKGIAISTSTLFAHPINASLMRNGNILMSDITDYQTENEIRHVYEYDPDTDTVLNDFTPMVEDKHLVLSEEIDANTLLVAYKDDVEQQRIIYWYSYSRTDDALTYMSETIHDRVYTQGCSLRGRFVYVMTNNISTYDSIPAKMITVNLATGEIVNETIFYRFGETESFFISYSEAPGTYAFLLDNSDHYIYMVKLA